MAVWGLCAACLMREDARHRVWPLRCAAFSWASCLHLPACLPRLSCTSICCLTLPCPALPVSAAIKMTALGLPTLLERASNSHIAIRDLFRRFDTGGWAAGCWHMVGWNGGLLVH